MVARRFKAKNKIQNSRILFNERAKYRNDAISKRLEERYPGLFRNFWFIENMYYGKIDRQHRFLIPKEEKLKTLQLDGSGDVFLFDFVADAVLDLVKDHKKALSSGKITKGETFLTTLAFTKGYTNVLYDYELHVKALLDSIQAQIFLKEQEIENFDDFMNIFFDLYNKQETKLPFSLTGFIASRYSPLTMTGLFTEVGNISYDDDQTKIDELIDKRNFHFFAKNCLKHGFLIDLNVPSRVCANLGSVEMERYLFKYNSNSQDVFSDYYNFSYLRDIDYIFQYLLDLYNRIVSLRPFIRKEVYDSRYGNDTYRFLFRRKQITKQMLDKKYTTEDKIKLYIDMRNYETNLRYNEALLGKIKENAISYLNISNLQDSLIYINHQFIGFLNDSGAFNHLSITNELKQGTAKLAGQEVQDLLNRSVVRSRKTLY